MSLPASIQNSLDLSLLPGAAGCVSAIAGVSASGLASCADARSEARTAGAARGPLGIPTVITANPAREKALQVVDSEGEITFFDRKTFAPVFDADAEKMQRWLMLRQAQQILSVGDDAFQLRSKNDHLPYSPFYFSGFVGPVKQKFSRSERIESRPVVCKLPYSPWLPGVVGPVDLKFEIHVDQAGAEIFQVQHLQPKFRTVLCLQRHLPGKDASVWQSVKTQNCSWHDLTVCGSPWFCPICSARINLGRQDQIRRVYDAVGKVGGSAYMLTFTVRHGVGDDCKVLVESMKSAMQLLQKMPVWKDFTRRQPLKRPQAGSMPFLDYIGRIAALEATHGVNGWHPHEHHLWFFKQKLSAQKINLLRSRLFSAWASCCVQCGMVAPLEKFGLDVREALSASEYIAKFADLGRDRRWGPEKEIASSHAKKGNKKGRSVMQILFDSMRLDEAANSVQTDFFMNADAFLFLDFANAFLGKHQLQVSRTLKKWLRDCGVDLDETDAGDQELAEVLESDSELQFEVDASDFLAIVRNKAQSAVLLTCKNLGSDAALAFIRSLPGRVEINRETAEFVRDVDSAVKVKKLAPSPFFDLLDTKTSFGDDLKNDGWLKGRDLDLWKRRGASSVLKGL